MAVGVPGRPTPLYVTRGYNDWVQVRKEDAIPKPAPVKKTK